MKMILLFACLALIVLTRSRSEISKQGPENIPAYIVASGSQDFKTTIQPILQNNCSPCHFPGGKMYVSMPFDKAETIILHEAGVTKRFRNKKECQAVIAFLEKNKMH